MGKDKMVTGWLVGVVILQSVSAMEVEREPKEGRGGPPDVVCGAWTNRVVNIGKNSAAKFEADKSTKRCTVLYKLTDCMEMQLTCSYLLVDNRDPEQCKRGNALTIRADDTKPERFCKRDYLGEVFPARAGRMMKVWYVNTEEDF